LRRRRAFTLAALAPGISRQIGRQLLMLALATGFVLLFQERLRALDMAEILALFHTVSLPQWAGALVATAVSFWAIGRYDGVLHRALGTGVGERSARRAGITAIALSQTIGFGLLTGTLIRWRLLPEMSFWQAMRFSAIVALSFLLAWAGLTGIAHLLLPGNVPGAGLAGLAALAIGAAVLWISLKRPDMGFLGLRLPTLLTMRAMIALTALDTFAAAMVFHALLPASADIGFAAFFPAFLLAFGIGMMSGTPGGMGPFEITLISLLPQVAPESLMAAAIGYRLIYFALPAILAMPILALGPSARPWPNAKALEMTPIKPGAPLPAQVNRLIHNAPFAEAHFLRQGDKSLLSRRIGRAHLMVGILPQTLVALRAPLAGKPQEALEMLRQAAHRSIRIPCLYKCDARMAVVARRAGFRVLPCAREALIDPGAFRLAIPGRRQLRRKLRKAEAGGVRILASEGPLPMADLSRINSAWILRQGGERGFSMGRYCPHYIQGQRIYMAYCKGRLQGFMSVNANAREWALDLMRQERDAPEGTMHALVTQAIMDAKHAGCRRFSLAAVPLMPFARAWPFRALPPALREWIGTKFRRMAGEKGLHQFKNSFAPRWQPLYIAAPGPISLLIAALDIHRRIFHPQPVHHHVGKEIAESPSTQPGGKPVSAPARIPAGLTARMTVLQSGKDNTAMGNGPLHPPKPAPPDRPGRRSCPSFFPITEPLPLHGKEI